MADAANASMERAFFNADGEWLIVPQQGRLRVITELGLLEVEPQEIVVLPRGLKFSIQLLDGTAPSVGRCASNHIVDVEATGLVAVRYVLPNAETRIERPMDYDAFVKSTGLNLLGNLPVTGSVGRS
jgi:homogentisate 1,2-dioxygenase